MDEIKNMGPQDLLKWSLETFGDSVAFSSSFGAEDMVVLDMLSTLTERPRVFTLDTGRLHPETYQLIEQAVERYKLDLKVYFPDTARVEAMVRTKGINLFYDGVEERKLCCTIRKVEPLQRALSGLKAWITGLRREQSTARGTLEKVGQDDAGRTKINPLADWSNRQVWDYIREHKVPYNKLHDQNFPTIGCAPCTRAVQPGEDIRAGRWWWEDNTKRECGLHVSSENLVSIT